MKECFKCHNVLSLNEFGKKALSKDGLQSHCKSCISKYNKLYKGNTKEHNSKIVKEYYLKNKEKILEYHKVYMKQPDVVKKERERCIKKGRKRRALKLEIQENYSKQDEQYTRELFQHQCANCGCTNELHIDHHYPLSKGNALTRQNAVVLCRSCNSSKGTKLPEEFYTSEALQCITEKLSKKTPARKQGVSA